MYYIKIQMENMFKGVLKSLLIEQSNQTQIIKQKYYTNTWKEILDHSF